MVDRNYAKDPVLIRDNKKLYGVIIVGALVFLFLQIGVRMFSKKHPVETAQSLVEDKGRTVFKENDVVKGLESFGKGAKESALKKLRTKNESHTFQKQEIHRDRLAPVNIIHHEKQNTQAAVSHLEEHKPLGAPLGTQVLALLKTKIFSFNIENHVEAESLKDVYYLGKLAIPKGTKFFGTVSVLHSENRVNMRFYRLLLPWGEERNCQAVAHSLDGSGGIKGKVDRHWFTRSFSLLGKTALSGLTLFTVPNRQNAFSMDDQLRLTASSNLAQEGSKELDNLKIEKSITVPGGILIKIIFLESL